MVRTLSCIYIGLKSYFCIYISLSSSWKANSKTDVSSILSPGWFFKSLLWVNAWSLTLRGFLRDIGILAAFYSPCWNARTVIGCHIKNNYGKSLVSYSKQLRIFVSLTKPHKAKQECAQQQHVMLLPQPLTPINLSPEHPSTRLATPSAPALHPPLYPSTGFMRDVSAWFGGGGYGSGTIMKGEWGRINWRRRCHGGAWWSKLSWKHRK